MSDSSTVKELSLRSLNWSKAMWQPVRREFSILSVSLICHLVHYHVIYVNDYGNCSILKWLVTQTIFNNIHFALISQPRKIIRAIFVLRLTYNPCDIVVYKIKSIVNYAPLVMSRKSQITALLSMVVIKMQNDSQLGSTVKIVVSSDVSSLKILKDFLKRDLWP